MKIGTKAVHKGQKPEEITGAVIPPIYQSTTFAQTRPGEPVSEFEYTRAGNPNFSSLEETLASLEEGKYATVFSAGLAALTAWMSEVGSGHVVANEDIYGGTYRLFVNVFNNFGLSCDFVETENILNWERAIKPETKWLLIETPTNPLLKIVDIPALCEIAHSKNVKVIVDNTFATPCLQRPLIMGADVVIHSTTKYLGGHSDVVGGVLITNDLELKKRFDFFRKAMGLNPSPFDCWLTGRGLKTLSIRMAQHEKNAFAVAKHLQESKGVVEVLYPGLTSHLQQALASKQMSGFGGMVSVRFADGKSADKFIKELKLFCLAESLGGVESLVCKPSSMTHASMPAAEREKIGIDDSLVRLSVGIEDTEDLLADIGSAIDNI
jgi:cystathionine beta-lyase/cystathionine gamma-synthase